MKTIKLRIHFGFKLYETRFDGFKTAVDPVEPQIDGFKTAIDPNEAVFYRGKTLIKRIKTPFHVIDALIQRSEFIQDQIQCITHGRSPHLRAALIPIGLRPVYQVEVDGSREQT